MHARDNEDVLYGDYEDDELWFFYVAHALHWEKGMLPNTIRSTGMRMSYYVSLVALGLLLRDQMGRGFCLL